MEVEAMHGASIVALTIYDMLKPIDKKVEIGCIRLLEKTGGKSSFKPETQGLSALVVVCSDSVSKGLAEDASGKLILEKLTALEIPASLLIIPDEAAEITRVLENASADLIIYTGGTGVGPRDITPDTLAPLLDMRLDGVEEQMRSYGQERTPYAMFSRSLAGIKNKHVILALPGSGKGVQECMDAVFPHLLHLFHVLKGKRHDS